MAIALDPKFETYRWFHDFDRAIDDFTRAIQLDPKSAIAYRKRAEAYEALGTNCPSSGAFRQFEVVKEGSGSVSV
jgi:Tfp pilus assembly protein PilF